MEIAPRNDLEYSGVEVIVRLMKRIYGDWSILDKNHFPKPLGTREAGPSLVKYADTSQCQRRYLWTDAFAVLNFVSLAQVDPSRREEYITAGTALIEATKATLGKPRSPELPMHTNSRGGYLGMRIGKVQAKVYSDPGMTLDGMYWHYLDKWMFCLLRFGQVAGKINYVEEAATMAKDLFPYFYKASSSGKKGGIHWKLTSDLKQIPGLPEPYPNDDAISALIIYSAIDTEIQRSNLKPDLNLKNEIYELRSVLCGYTLEGTMDPLGYGLTWWKAQWWDDVKLKRDLFRSNAAVLDSRNIGLPFRLYGALIGAKLSGMDVLISSAETLLNQLLPLAESDSEGTGSLSSINTVMYCSALEPKSFERLPSEHDVSNLSK